MFALRKLFGIPPLQRPDDEIDATAEAEIEFFLLSDENREMIEAAVDRGEILAMPENQFGQQWFRKPQDKVDPTADPEFVKLTDENREMIEAAVERGELMAWLKDGEGRQWYRKPPTILGVPSDGRIEVDGDDD